MDDSSATNLPDIIAAEGDYAAVHALLSKRTGAPSVLRGLMTLFESYRSARKYGWSRPWNKGGLRTFLTLEFSPSAEAAYSSLAADWSDIAQSQSSLAQDRGETTFLSSLVATSGARGFVFLHERLDAQGLFEGFTLSFGAVSARGRRYRDRFDVVVEQRLDNEDVPSKATKRDILVRVYEDRFLVTEGNRSEQGPVPLLCQTLLPGDHVDVAHLLSDSLTLLRRDALDSARHWDHWTQDVIDYFGPRRFPELATWFNDASFVEEMARRKNLAFHATTKTSLSREPRA
ncbi:MAG: hypothetical protein IOD12_07800 [Silvanigrellales bacterium]|nr:hypothetical protein [Silvanigrellales bacterium]